MSYFNPRSREGSDAAIPDTIVSRVDFNPRSREGSDQQRSSIGQAGVISIHAPVKGATSFLMLLIIRHGISIHAPVKGATYITMPLTDIDQISIHAPVKGATDIGQQ